jgi:hypothetical protein
MIDLLSKETDAELRRTLQATQLALGELRAQSVRTLAQLEALLKRAEGIAALGEQALAALMASKAVEPQDRR